MSFRNPFKKPVKQSSILIVETADPSISSPPSLRVVNCKHEHWKTWRNNILVTTTTCGDFNCEGHRGSIYLTGRQCVQPGCGVTWRVDWNNQIPNFQWRERAGGGGEHGPVTV